MGASVIMRYSTLGTPLGAHLVFIGLTLEGCKPMVCQDPVTGW